MAADDLFSPQTPGGQNYMTMTPGSAVADTLQQILAQRRAEAHSNLVEQLNQQNTSRRLDIEQQQANTQEGYRKALEADRAETTQDRAAKRTHDASVANSWTIMKDQLVPGNPMFDNLPADQQRGASFLRNLDYDHPLVQSFMKSVLTPESPKNDLVPAFRRNEDNGNLEPDMIDATPPLVGKVQRQAPRGSEIQVYRPHHETPREGPQLEIVNKDGSRGVYVAPMGATGVVKLPPEAAQQGWALSGFRVGGPPRQTTSMGDLYDSKTAENMIKDIANKKGDPRAKQVAVSNFISQAIKDRALRGDVEDYYRRRSADQAAGLTPTTLDTEVGNVAPYEATNDPSFMTSNPQLVKNYQDNFRRLVTMLNQAQGIQ